MVIVCSNVKIPSVNGNGKNSVAEIMITILASEWPLSMKSVHYRLTKRHSMDVSFQAVHKAAKKLVEEGILERDKSQYFLNKTWIDSLHEFAEQIRKEYVAKDNYNRSCEAGSGFNNQAIQPYS